MVTIELIVILPDMANKEIYNTLLTCYSDLIGILGKRGRVTKQSHDDGAVS